MQQFPFIYYWFDLISCSFFSTFIQAVPTSRGQALADEYGIKFFETVSL